MESTTPNTPAVHKPKVLAQRIEMQQYQPVAATEKYNNSGWLNYGDDNQYPLYLKEIAETSPIHGAIVKGVAKLVYGKGLSDDAISKSYKFKKVLPSVCMDMVLYGGFYLEYVYGKDTVNGEVVPSKEVVQINHLPFENCRLAVTENLDIVGVYYSRDWKNIRKAINKPKLIQLRGSGEASYVSISFLDETTSTMYPSPSYKSCINYIEIDRQISIFHVSNILNNFAPGTIVSLFNGMPEEETKSALKSEFQGVSGASNAGKTVVLFNEPDQPEPKITTFQLNDADKQYDLLNRTATEKILVGHLVTTPLLFGIKFGGDGFSSNADEMKQGLFMYMTNVINPMREIIIDDLEENLQVQGLKFVDMDLFETAQPAPVPTPTQVPAPVAAHKHELSKPEMTEEQEVAWLNHLYACGEIVDLDEYELVEEEVVNGEPTPDEHLSKVNLAHEQLFKRFANPDAKSENDGGLVKVRYKYSTGLSDNSRIFCKNMVAASKAGVVYRYEDIIEMGDSGVNKEFAAAGENTYSIFLYKGGANCHHFWSRQVYFRKRENGKFLPNKGLTNDERISQREAAKKGFEFKDAQYWAEASTRPYDMPNNGYKNPR